jgi:hypothetical protein
MMSQVSWNDSERSEGQCSTTNHITIDELIKLLKEYDFKKNSIKKFANEYKISEKTVTKYLKQNNIDYNSRTLLIYKNRDVNGRFCLSINSLTSKMLNSSNPFGAERDASRTSFASAVKDNKFRRSIAQLTKSDEVLPSAHHEFHESKTIEKIKINPTKNQNLSEKSYEEKLRRIMTLFK